MSTHNFLHNIFGLLQKKKFNKIGLVIKCVRKCTWVISEDYIYDKVLCVCILSFIKPYMWNDTENGVTIFVIFGSNTT